MKTTLAILVAACLLSEFLIEAASMTREERKEARKEERKREREQERERERRKEEREMRKLWEQKNEMANKVCSPLKDMLVENSPYLCELKKWKLGEMIKAGENITCFDDMKNNLLEKVDNMTKIFMGDASMQDMISQMEDLFGNVTDKLQELMEGYEEEEQTWECEDDDNVCKKALRKYLRQQERKQKKKGGDDEDDMDDFEPDFGMNFEMELTMEKLMAAMNVTDMEGLKAVPLQTMIDRLSRCDKCADRKIGCMKVNAWLKSKIQMLQVMHEAYEENSNSCVGIMDKLKEKMSEKIIEFMEMYYSEMEE